MEGRTLATKAGDASGRKRLLVGLLVAVVLIGAVGYFAPGRLPFLSHAFGRSEDAGKPEIEGKEAKNGGDYRQLPLESMVVNLADAGRPRYLRVTITLEYTDPKVQKEMERLGHRVRDSIIQVLRSKQVADLAPDKTDQVRRELLSAVNGLLGGDKVTGLYFQEFIIQ